MDLEEEEFWCELVLNGIGGRTIEKAKKTITPREFAIWRAYREKRGSLFIGRRVEQGFGNLMAHHTMFKVKDPESVSALTYMPHEDVPVTTFEEERLKAIKKKSA